MSNHERSAFEQCALASGLLSQQQLDEARSSVRWSEGDEPDPSAPPSDRQLADRLVEMRLLNAWQAKQLLDGRTKFNLGPYSIIDSIGQGGVGQVFKARHGKMGRTVAVKVLPRDKSTPQAVANFTREIRALFRLNHPRLVAALDAGQDGNVYYLVTEYVPGMDLRKLIRQQGPLDVPTAASIISQVAEGLEYAHAQGIIHRDVKPGNVLVSPDGEAKLSDLGFASPLDSSLESDPRYGKIAGTADYLSPDQIRDPRRPAPAWDIYSLGCTLYYAVTGKVPFPGGTTADRPGRIANCGPWIPGG
jgi:serine/threonine protein kinase